MTVAEIRERLTATGKRTNLTATEMAAWLRVGQTEFARMVICPENEHNNPPPSVPIWHTTDSGLRRFSIDSYDEIQRVRAGREA